MTLSWAVNSPLWSESGISSLYSFLLSDDHPLADCSYQMPVTDGQATCWDHIGWGHCPWALSRTFLAETRDPVKLDTIPHPDRKRLCRNARTFLYFKKGEPWCLAKGIIWPTKKENSRLSKEALRPLKFINRFLCVFFFLNWGFIEEISSLWLFLREVMNLAIREEQTAGGGLCRSQRAVVTVQIKMVTVILATERSSTHECTWNPRLHTAFSLCFILIHGVLVVRDSAPLVAVML